ncbi:MAG: hypothetical protein COS84_07640 [Armatimonadetes bacterium CG07_land_8_20_14_0_80_40_9]|nr:MAG: hypothetical protein COS84_07640 [Armatimonadetes bacterium CG07_land_8_20_14_0_80_40_9]
MKKEIEYALDKLGDAFSRLKEGALQAKDELDKDGVIQRFEFTFEQFWKSLRIFLEDEGLECRTPKDGATFMTPVNCGFDKSNPYALI